jgi:outer membrane protein insertion porin family
MYKLYKFLLLILICGGASSVAFSQDSTHDATSINADLINIFNQKPPKKYKISKITVTGNRYFDETLLTSI